MSARGQTGEMVQTKDGPEDGSLGKTEPLPPEISSPEAFQRIWIENQDLRVALEQSNAMLRKSHSEMVEFQTTQKRERTFIAYKFSEAKNLVQRLTRERDSLQAKLEAAKMQLAEMTSKDDQAAQCACSMSAQKKALEEEEPVVQKVFTEIEVLQGADERCVEREQNLKKQLQEAERRGAELEEKFTELQLEVSSLKDQLKEKGIEAQKQLQLLAEEKASVKAQVTSLLGELNESQMSLEASEMEKRKLEDSLRILKEQQREWELQMKQHVIQLDQRRMQVQSLETALKVERQNASEEMRKLAQLQAAYHKLFQEYDTHIKNGLQQEKLMKSMDLQLQELKQQLQEAEEALVAKQELIDKLKMETDEQKSLKETIGVLKAQVDIFCADFQAERQARERLHAEKERLQEQLDELKRERTRLDDMRNRHIEPPRQSLPSIYPMQYPNAPSPFYPSLVEVQEYRCPKCQYKAPDIDTLQIHVMDCIK
ncbi:NF-kappa-B essential modulator isoform X6 [Pyxicephalus adspersus]|uniref:NF-kappa-B essential modulator isoform X6 n=1 Tax=Pyxicephalus adspersus TaxID=30357 RepID=UPI003B592892